MVSRASVNETMLLGLRVETVTHIVELLDFVLNRIGNAWAHDFPESLKKRKLQLD
jgi:hypothetical protein